MHERSNVSLVSTLREEQKRLVRTRILDALAEEIVAGGLVDLSIPAVADRAGVSVRTVYNYFPTKDDLMQAFAESVDQWLTEHGAVMVTDEFPPLIPALETNFTLFSELGTWGAAAARMRAERRAGNLGSPLEGTRQRTAAFRAAVASLRPDLDAGQATAVTAVMRSIASFETWDRLTHDFGLDGAQAGRVASWALAVMAEALESGRGPFDDDGVPPGDTPGS